MTLAESSAKDMPVGYDDPYRDVERDALRDLDRVLDRVARGLVWAERAIERKKPKRPAGRPRANPPRPRRHLPMPDPLWRIRTPTRPARAEPPPPSFTAFWPPKPFFYPDRDSMAIDGYVEFEIRWETFGVLALVTDIATAGYYCDLARRDNLIRQLYEDCRWPRP